MKYRQILLWILYPFFVYAQTEPQPLDRWESQLNIFGTEVQQYDFQLFTDKSIYTPNEYIWLSAFDARGITTDTSTRCLFVFLSDNFQKRPLMSCRFLMKQGLATGSFTVPDTLKDGNYSLVAYTDDYLNGSSGCILYKDILIRSARPTLIELLSFEEYPIRIDDTIKLKYFVSGTKQGIIRDAKVTYSIYDDTVLVVQGTTKTNERGEIAITKCLGQAFRSKTLDLVLNVEKDTMSRTEFSKLYPSPKFLESAPYIVANQDTIHKKIILSAGNIEPIKEYYLIASNASGILYSGKFSTKKRETTIRLDSDSFPPGALNFQIFNSKGKNIAEQSIEVKPHRWKLIIKPDSTTYKCRSVVQMKVKCRDLNDIPIQGTFSIACVYKKRILGGALENTAYRKIPLPELHKVNSFAGEVRWQNGQPAGNTPILIIGGESWGTLVSDSLGRFSISPNMIRGAPRQNITVSVAGASPEKYSLNIIEPDRIVNSKLASLHLPQLQYSPESKEVFSQQEIHNWKNMLKPVTVKAPKQKEYIAASAFLDDPCDGWVCSCGHWKCMECPPRVIPIKGRTYIDLRSNTKFIFDGCLEERSVPYLKRIKPIITSEGFPLVNHATSNDIELYSTLFWNPAIQLDDNGEASILFYTNDLKGKFSISIDGKAGSTSIHGETQIDVQ